MKGLSPTPVLFPPTPHTSPSNATTHVNATPKVIVSFGTESDGGVSLPKFLLFLGKEYGRGGRFDGGKGGGRSLGRRLRLILQKVRPGCSRFAFEYCCG